MHSIYYCKKCSIDFPSVSRYVKHRKLFCQLGRGKEDLNEGIPEDGIGKLTIAEATKRISRAIELRTKEVDPAVYQAVEQVRLYKKKRRSDGKKLNEQRNEVLKRLADLKQEMRELEATFTEKNKKYESIKAYSKVSALEITGTEELLDELHDLKNAMVYIEDEIASNIDCLHLIESGKYKPSEARFPEEPGTVLDNISSKRNAREHSTRKHSTREHTQLPALKIHTPLLTPLTKPVTRDMTRDMTRDTTRDMTPIQEVDGREHSRAISAPRVSVRQTLHSQDNDTASVVSARTLKPGSADSVVLLSKLQRKRDIILLQREIRTMEQGEQDGVTDVLSDSALIPYLPESGVVVYIDYLTPTFHISANLMLAVIRDSKIVSQTSTFIVTPASHVSFLGYHETFPNLAASNDTYLYSSVRTLEGEELGWCLFNLFSERTLNSGAWRIPLKSPPFTHDLVSTLYHGARSLNYSLRLRCSVTSVHEAMLIAPKLKLAQYKIHNPGFEDQLIISKNVNKPDNKQKIVRNQSQEKVAETYGPPDDFDPIKILRKGNKSTPIRPMPAPGKTATPAVELLPVPEPPEPTETPERIKGLHYHTLLLSQPSLPPSLSLHVQYCEIDEEYNIKNSVSFPSSSSACHTTLLNQYSLDYKTLELTWNQEEIVLLFTYKDSEDSVVGWSWALYSDKRLELEVFKPPIPSFSKLAQWLEELETNDIATVEEEFTRIANSGLLVRYYDSKEWTPRFPDRPDGYFLLPQPRLPTGAFRHVEPKPNFTVHDKNRSITLIIDGARYLPSCVTISRVTGRIFDRDFNILGPQISSSVVLDSDIYNPIYKYSVKLPGDLPKTSITVLKLYTLHVITGQLTTVGYSLLNLFCKRGTVLEAEATDPSVVLNKGAMQLPLHIDGPDAGLPLMMDSLKDVYCVPCSWLLVRLMYTSDDGSIPLMPSYNDGVYADNHPNLSATEIFVLDSYRKRPITNGKKVCNVDPTPAAVIKKLTRHKGQAIRDMVPAEIIEYSPESGVGVKVVGVKNLSSREPESTLFTYLRLSTRETMFKFTDHLLYNECVQFNIGHKIKWTDQIHYFKHVTPSPDVFLLVQFLEHSNDQFTMVGWIQIPIFSHTGPMTFVNRTNRSEMPLTLGSLDPSRQSRPLDLKSELDSEGGAAYAVVEVFDTRFSSESRAKDYEADHSYITLAEKGVDFIAQQMSESRDFIQ